MAGRRRPPTEYCRGLYLAGYPRENPGKSGKIREVVCKETSSTAGASGGLPAFLATFARVFVDDHPAKRIPAEDADGTVVSYAWTAPAGAFDAADQASATWTAPETPGDVEITVTVTDDDVDTAAATVTVTVQAPDGNQPPTVSATAEPPTVEPGYRPDSCRNTLQGGPAGRVVELDAEQPRDQPRRPPEGTLVARTAGVEQESNVEPP